MKAAPVGAVVVRNGEIFGHGGNRAMSTTKPTAHADFVAQRRHRKNLHIVMDGVQSCETRAGRVRLEFRYGLRNS
jgi:tRNA(Arg) A34 adenosine deaminase TadA